MSRPRRGTIARRQTKQGISYGLRLSLPEGRQFLRLGGSWEGWTEARAQRELDYITEQIDRGEWVPPRRQSQPSVESEATTFRVFASKWVARQKTRLPADSKTYKDLQWRLNVAVDYLGERQLDEIDEAIIDDMVLALLKERERIQEAADGGEPEYDVYIDPRTRKEHKRRRRGLSNGSINKVLAAVERVFRDARRRKLITHVPVDKDSRVRAERPRRSFLELEQALALLEAARSVEDDHRGLTWHDVTAIRSSEESHLALARRYEVSDTLIRKIRRGDLWVHETQRNRNDVPRRPIIATLTLAGVRVSELCALDRAHIDFPSRRIRVPRVKTDASERVIPMVPALFEILLGYCTAFEADPAEPLFPTRNGRRNNPDNIRKRIVAPVHARASELLEARGRAKIPHLTPHTFRRTFASLLAEVELPPRRAMYLLGHTDPTLTMSVYQQVLDVGETTSELLAELLGTSPEEAKQVLGGRHGTTNRSADAQPRVQQR